MRILLVFLLSGLAALAPAYAQSRRTQHYKNSLAPNVPSPQPVIERMLELAEVRPSETVYDLGSGEGRVLITAVQRFHAKAVGVEISDELCERANSRIARLGLQNEIRLIHDDIMNVDLSPADVVVMYLMTGSNELLRPKLEQALHPGARVVSHDYEVPGWKPSKVDKTEATTRGHMIYLYVMPPKKR